jgi:hypothetical protein
LKFECKFDRKVLAFADIEKVERERFAAEAGKALSLALQVQRSRENGRLLS